MEEVAAMMTKSPLITSYGELRLLKQVAAKSRPMWRTALLHHPGVK
jgi:hypothetical protein